MTKPILCLDCRTFIGNRPTTKRCKDCREKQSEKYLQEYHQKRKLDKWKDQGLTPCNSRHPSGVVCLRPKNHKRRHIATIFWNSEVGKS